MEGAEVKRKARDRMQRVIQQHFEKSGPVAGPLSKDGKVVPDAEMVEATKARQEEIHRLWSNLTEENRLKLLELLRDS
jgi:hypothetical protein